MGNITQFFSHEVFDLGAEFGELFEFSDQMYN